MVSKYTGLSFFEIDGLDYVTYLAYRRDAYICHLETIPGGREYLGNAWRMEQTKPDRSGLRKHFGRKEAPSNGS